MAIGERGIVNGCVISFCYTGSGVVVRLSKDRRCRSLKVLGSGMESRCFGSLSVGILQCSGSSIGGGFQNIYRSVLGRVGWCPPRPPHSSTPSPREEER